MITPSMIQDRLAKLQDLKNQRSLYMKPPDAYEQFMPATLGFQPRDMSLMYGQVDNISQTGRNATELTRTKMDNLSERNAMLQQRREMNTAIKRLAQLKANQPKRSKQKPATGGTTTTPTTSYYGGTRNFSPKWGKDNTPQVSDIKQLRPNAQIVNVNWRGRSFNVNRQVAPIFVALLDDLFAAGYKPVSIGGHSPRNIAGTNTTSLHSYGMAIDIDSNLNAEGTKGVLPPRVAALAAKYGLAWGGNWTNRSKDPMHFSVPYGGTE